MKRRRESEMVPSEIRSAVHELSSLVFVNLETSDGATADTAASDHHQTAQVPIKPFLSLCNLLIQVLDKIGPTMAVFRQDINQNIQRLENFSSTDASLYWDVVEILKKEVNEGNAKKGTTTCSKAFVWLNRSLDFTLALLQLLVKDFEINMQQAVEESYNITLKPWHGWISSTAYRGELHLLFLRFVKITNYSPQVAIRLVPDSQTLVNILKAKDEDHDMLKEEIRNLISLLSTVLEQNNNILRAYGLDKLKST